MLKKAILDEPSDPFYPYALALEFIHSNRSESLQLFRSLLVKHPDYLPTYYQTGLLMIESGNDAEGIETLNKGIELAMRQGDRKAAGELRTLLDSI